jgi:WD40 repeat protein
MSDRPDFLPEFATDDVDVTVNGVDQPNKVRPPVTKRTDGFTFKEKPPLNWLNYLFNKIREWLQYLDERYRYITITSSTTLDAVSNINVSLNDSSIDLTLPESPIVGDTVEVYSLDNSNNIIPNDDQVIVYNDDIWTDLGSYGALNIPRSCQVSLVYNGLDEVLSETIFTQLSDPSTLPTSTGNGVAFSPDGNFMAVAHNGSPFVTIYSISGNTFTKLPDPAILPTGIGEDIAFSPDGNFMAVAHDVSPYVTIYSISGTTFTKIADPSTALTADADGVAFSPDSAFMAVAGAGDRVVIYDTSTIPFTKITDLSASIPGVVTSIALSPDGNFLAVGSSTSPFIYTFSISGTTFTLLPNPTTLPDNIGNAVAFSSDSSFLIVANTGTPSITIYDTSTVPFTKISDPAILPAGAGRGVAASPNGAYIAIANTSSPYITIYSVSGTTFTKITDPSDLPTNACFSIAFSPTGGYLSVGQYNISPYLFIYRNIVNNENIWKVLEISPKNGEVIEELFT